jgi:hypothetical protein
MLREFPDQAIGCLTSRANAQNTRAGEHLKMLRILTLPELRDCRRDLLGVGTGKKGVAELEQHFSLGGAPAVDKLRLESRLRLRCSGNVGTLRRDLGKDQRGREKHHRPEKASYN